MQKNKEQFVLLVGFVLILLVLLFTMFRSDFFSQKNSSQQNEEASSDTETSSEKKIPTISVSDLQKKISQGEIGKGVTLLDVRPFDSYIEEHVVDSFNLPLDEFPAEEKIEKRNQIVIIGQNPSDSNITQAFEKLKKEDFKNLTALTGGIDAWKEQSGLTVSYGNPESFVDQSKVSYLDPEQLNEALKSEVPVYIVDVRSENDYKNGHIKGAVNIPFDELETKRGQISERKVVVVGANELQEFQASVQIYDMLLASPFVMRTAMPGWQSKGFELIK